MDARRREPPDDRSGPIEFEEERQFTGPEISDELIEQAEATLGVSLPASYRELLRVRNGGIPVRRCYPTTFPTSWTDDHFEIAAILGVGGPWGIESSAYLVAEWSYPAIGVVICLTPSGGHDTVMLDYTDGTAEPAVAYVDEDRVPRRIAGSFAEFLGHLTRCGNP